MTTPVPFLIASAGVLGLIVGSFLNVVVHRVPQGVSVVSPPSACAGCGAAIRWYDNIPVVSWLLLRGRCRDCGAPISMRYPAIELLTGLVFAGIAWWASPWLLVESPLGATAARWLVLLALLHFAAVGIALAAIDLQTRRLPNAIVLPALAVALLLLLAAAILSGDWGPLLDAVIAMAALFAFYLVILLIYPPGMGFGDVKLAALVGLHLGWFGWPAVIVGAFAAFLLGGVVALALLVTRRAGRRSGIPFGPYLLGGAWLGILLGPDILFWYLGLFGLSGGIHL